MKTIRFEGVDHQFPDEATDDEIAAALEDLSAPPALPARTGREAEGGFGEGPDQPHRATLAENIFPTASQPQPDVERARVAQPIPGTMAFDPLNSREVQAPVSAVDKGIRTTVEGVGDLMSLPSRGAAAALTDQKMSDPGAYALRGPAEAAADRQRAAIEEGEAGVMADRTPLNDWMRMQKVNPAGTPPEAIELVNQIASDPLTWAPLLGPLLRLGPKALNLLGKGAGFLNRQTGALAEEVSGVPETALRAYGDAGQRTKIAANFGKEKEIGDELLQNIENPDAFLPERQAVDEALEKMGPIDLGTAVQSLEGAKGPAVAGRVSPEKGAANAGIQKYIDFLRGGPLPEDLAQGAAEARRAAGEAGVDAAATGAMAGQDAKAATQATRQHAQAQSKAAKAAAAAGKAKKAPGDAFYSWDRKEAEAAVPKALNEARQAAAKAKEAATEARAKVAVGEISQAEADAAQKTAETAARAADVAEVAHRLHKGEKIGAVAKDYAGRGFSKDDLRDLLQRGKQKAEGVGELPDQTVSAKDYRKLRQDLDVPVNWEQEGAGIKNQALKTGRTTMKNELLRKAEDSGVPGYAEAMRSWSTKLDKLEEIKGLLGKTGSTRDRRVEQFINNLFGKNSEHKQQLMRDLDEIFKSDLTERAQAAQHASELGPKGRPGILPQQVTGASLKPFLLANLIPGVGQVAAASTASPWVASRMTLPMLTKLEKGLEGAGVALSPKAEKAIQALKKPASEAQKVRLASILAAELEASLPSNAIPFHIQRAAESDEPPRLQKLRAALEKAKDPKTRQRLQAEIDKLQPLSMKGN